MNKYRFIIRHILLISFSAALLSIFITGCAPPPKKPAGLFPVYPGPQIAVEPTHIRLGVSTLLKTEIVIGGMGFVPGDSIFINLIGTGENSDIKVPIDVADAGIDGQFKIKIKREIKAVELLRLNLDPEDNKPIIVRDPIPTGVYIITAETVESKRRAECILFAEAPSKMDRIKDKIGILLRKIKKE
jgi:hypothetical protein